MKIQNILFYNQPITYQFGLTVLRIIIGLLMFYHGIEVFNAQLIESYSKWDSIKALPFPPLLMAYLGKGAEFISGLLLTLGLMTRLASFIMAGTMLFICFMIGQGRFWYEDQHPFVFALFAILFFFTGAGKFSFDEWLSGKK
jgi:putative oxidoreductase